MENETISEAFNKISTDIDEIVYNQERMARIMDAFENEIEETKKQIWFLAQAVKKLKEVIEDGR
jgi:methyl-accepting chemotaxis protein